MIIFPYGLQWVFIRYFYVEFCLCVWFCLGGFCGFVVLVSVWLIWFGFFLKTGSLIMYRSVV